ncbi:C4-dicarboxylate ABC transporter [Zobellella endophytica]|uniref:C4-dicarboxylate ABC transporter n=1 Tax=Zobellella endophytica TaxID=2116700 RepID=A0A2P7RD12_9GAMM|nr:TRAP transporter permease [Zobellella endophytica]PSJ48118.1 C4-dicarboxylate ABC transporter [Zobellella endophytica]
MSHPPQNNNDHQQELDDLLAVDTGPRHPAGLGHWALLLVPFAWTLFQLWYVSPLPFVLNFGILNDTEARAIHLAFAIFLAFTAYPALKHSPRDRIPLQDWLLALAGAFAAAYLFLFYRELSTRPGLPITQDLVVGCIGMLLLLEATRRALGPPLMVVAAVFLTYTFAGPYMPDVIAHRGASLNRTVTHQWLTTEGVFGVALGVSTSFVFMFVLFGSLLERAGAGNYFIKVAFSLLGHMRGGPAKAAVVASGLSGLVSGSSIANVVTTGTFTIPLMKRVGFPASKAGAVEVAASTNGQLTPPIMGAAAFLMVEYVGISYIEVIKAAILPALISYAALLYIVHLEAVKAGMAPLQQRRHATLLQRLLGFFTTVVGLMALSALVYYGIGWTKSLFGAAATWVLALVSLLVYTGLVAWAARLPDLEIDDPDNPDIHMPEPGPTFKAGIYYLLPIVVLVWCLTVERLSPGLSAFWATLFMMFIVVTHKPMKAFFRRQRELPALLREGADDLFMGMVTGARNMIGIGVATAAAGIVVGTVTLTGIGLVMTEFVEFISGGNLLLMLLFTAVISLLLGMGLPTTANYIVVSTLMAPVIVNLGAQHGLIVPLIAVHLFVFYFGILADDTPPVGLAAFAAAAIAKSDPIRTGLQGFAYDIRTAILPFMFIFNTQLLLLGIESWWGLLITILSALAAMLLFAAATQGFWLVKSRWWETLALLLVTFTLFRPGFFWDRMFPPMAEYRGSEWQQVIEALPRNESIILQLGGNNLFGEPVSKIVKLNFDAAQTDARGRLASTGISALRAEGGKVVVDMVEFGSQAERLGVDFDLEIVALQRPADRPRKEWMFIPALALAGLIAWLQRRRRSRAS